MDKIIQLICLLDEVEEQYFDICDHDIINDFNFKLNKLFPISDDLTGDILREVAKLDNHYIFTDSKYFTNIYEKNVIRKKIADYIEENCYFYIDYEIVKNNVKDNYKLFRYLRNEDKYNIVKIQELIDINPKVMLLVPSRFFSSQFVLDNMKKNTIVSEIFSGKYGEDNILYQYSDCYDDKEIQKLLFEQLKDSLKGDKYCYIHYSSLAKNNIELAKIILKMDPKFIAYTGKKIRKNKEIMLSMIKLDKNNVYYLDDSLKNDNDIIAII